MASKKPPEYPSRFQQFTDFARSAADSAGKAVAAVEEYVGAPDEDPEQMGLLQKEIIQPLKGVGKWALFDLWPGLKKIGRGLTGMVAAPFIAIAGAVTGIPPTEVNNLIGGLNTAEGFGGVWRKFKDLSKTYVTEWREMTAGQKFVECWKRAASVVANPIMGAVSGFFNTGLANVLGGTATIAGGLGRLQEKLSKNSALYQVLEKTTPFGKVAELAGNATKSLETVMNTANMWGIAASKIAQWGWVKKILSPERIKLWQAYGNDLLVAAAKGDKKAIAEMVKNGVMDMVGPDAAKVIDKAVSHAGGLAKRLGASEHSLEQIKRLAQGDISALNEVVKNFIPGFDIKDTKSFMNFTTTVKQTFTSALTQFSAKYVKGADFEKVTVRMTDLLGVKGAALEGMKKKLGEKVLGENFETIRAKGDKMVAAAADFVKNIADPNLREKMGYTMAAGNVQEALAALVKQNASPDFIGKIHTFKLRDGKGKETILDPSALAAFKEKALTEVAKMGVADKPVITAAKPKPPMSS